MKSAAEGEKRTKGLKAYLSPLAIWAFSFGCAVGWGAFVMPGTVFLPAAGPIGTVLGMVFGTGIIWIIGRNYFRLMQQYPDAGGAYTYTREIFGYDHGFLCAWFLLLVYIAIGWANMTALVLIGRNVMGPVLQFGFHYQMAGFDIYFGEILVEILVYGACGLVCIYRKKLAVWIQIVFAVILLGGILIFTWLTLFGEGASISLHPAFAETGHSKAGQLLAIMAMAPWGFAGFESVSHLVQEVTFPVAKMRKIMLFAVLTAMVAYVCLSLVAVSRRPADFADWQTYIHARPTLTGTESMPVLYAVWSALGQTGLYLLGVVIIGGVVTGIIGNMIAASRLMVAMAQDRVLPGWFGQCAEDGTPRHAISFILIASMVIPFCGRVAVSWIVDVTTVCATVAYAYVSAGIWKQGREKYDRRDVILGMTGLVASVLFALYLLVPNFWTVSALEAESYLMLSLWGILGFIFFRAVFVRDEEHRFGRSTVVWIALLFLIFYASLMWVRQEAHLKTQVILADISTHHQEELARDGITPDAAEIEANDAFLAGTMDRISTTLLSTSFVLIILSICGLAILFNVYSIMQDRERHLETARARAEENSKAKTIFLSNMSHDIRTPMNAIIGYLNLAKREDITLPELREYMDKIEGSSQHLLALINDVLEMSRIESGKMELEMRDTDLIQVMDMMRDMFATQMREKKIDYDVCCEKITEHWVMCDRTRLNRILLNLISNAYKFTPEGGSVRVRLIQLAPAQSGRATYELRVKDSGIGMNEEFAERVFEAFERERTSTVSGIQGTGLGMAITKSIVELMGGEIQVQTAPGEGTEITVRLTFDCVGDQEAEDAAEAEAQEQQAQVDFRSKRLLLVEDMQINMEIASMLLRRMGFVIETATNGQEAVDMVTAAEPGYYDGVLMDIQMPVMNGYDATRAIRQLPDPERARVPVIAMTANAFTEDIRQARDAGMNAHIAKPIDLADMTRTLTEVLAGR
ncbi:MAG: amino acid permease [Butyrivibrio sp.]|nr:amino acid permease [Butyrivibrio sp.]